MGKKYILGVDPGLSGALAIIDPLANSIIDVTDTPVVPSGIGNRKMINVQELTFHLDRFSNDILFSVIEEVHSTPNDGPVGAFSFGKSFGIVIGIVGAFRIPIFFTPPSVWKNCMGLSTNKGDSRKLAGDKYPKSRFLFERKKDDGRAESVLIADFGRRFIK